MLLDEERWAGARGGEGRQDGRRWRRVTAGLAAPGRGFWALVGALIGIDAVWLAVSGPRLAWPGLLVVSGVVAGLLGLSLLFSAVKAEPKLRAMALSSAYLAAFTTAAAVLHELTATLAMPLIDPALARGEAMMGFDWRAWLAFLAEHPDLSQALALAYHSSGPQVGVVVIVLSAASRVTRLWRFARLFSVSLLVSVGVSALFPALGPYAFYEPQLRPAGHLETVGALWHLEALQALRGGTLAEMALSEIRGLVTFPSFHACLAVLTAWALAPIPVVGPVAFALNGTIILATLGAGGHYLPDVLAGTGLGLALVGFRHVRGRIGAATRPRSGPAADRETGPPASAPRPEHRPGYRIRDDALSH